jgi:dienelactone hydrolase
VRFFQTQMSCWPAVRLPHAWRVLGCLAGLTGLLAGLLGGCTTGSSPEATARTYESARISIPRVAVDGTEVVAGYHGRVRDDPAQAQLRALAARGLRMPTVLYLHGCTGLGFAALVDLAQIAEAGAIAYAPDSYARPGRPAACDETRHTHGGLGMWLLRFEEAAHARDRLAAEPWIDDTRVVLMGFSEGGFAVALSRDPRYVGYVVSGANCVGYNNQNGLAVPPHKPVLVILSRFDPWFSTPEACTASLAGRPNSRSVILDKPGHHMNGEPEAREALRGFLGTTLKLK